ncbi:hypothetical protein PC129_g23116 [Phytophthora cactorum]|uniref:Uncharacterized protein n=1 Tax=Phytophthora cactorum TaxID=29920 RepID=A0A329RF20_9STRA|nr:hypothetical protein PC111_g23084 [Phytophthora cactorum]KAG2793688.1 hypothetical protein PC112_g23336 [Phytophthora cactorum]KAG2815444.1 hypothetical protein PC113_g23203 [Phytophthora cactorum]KAG2873095.1 hypothetical protein PC114_g26030 [Phytophthora cactorum]KAG2878170.1 hypothetical protein PC115_g23140 [Phytophthora cactorum]
MLSALESQFESRFPCLLCVVYALPGQGMVRGRSKASAGALESEQRLAPIGSDGRVKIRDATQAKYWNGPKP